MEGQGTQLRIISEELSRKLVVIIFTQPEFI